MRRSNNGSLHSKHGVEAASIAMKTSIWGPISVGYAAGFLPLYWLVMREIISNIIGHNAATSPAHPVSHGIPRGRRAMDWSGIRSAAPECRMHCIEKSHLS